MNSTTIGRDNAERIFTLDLAALARAIQLDPALRITHRHSMPTRNGLAWSALIGGAIEACDDGHGGMISLRVHERRHDDADATLAALQRVARLFGIEISPTTRGSLVDDPTEDTGLLISAMLDATEAS